MDWKLHSDAFFAYTFVCVRESVCVYGFNATNKTKDTHTQLIISILNTQYHFVRLFTGSLARSQALIYTIYSAQNQ